jgi:hypothetical protein
MTRFVTAIGLTVALAGAAPAQDKKWEPPPPPDGWTAVAGKDGTYRFAFPPDAKRTGSRDRTTTVNGVKTQAAINYCTLADGTTLEVAAFTLSGPGLKGAKAADVLDGFVAAEKDAGFTLSDPKPVTVGGVAGKEYRLTNDKLARRMVLFAVKPRVYELDVTAADAAKLDSAAADTFVKSFVVVPAEAVKAAATETAAKDGQAGKEAMEKFGAKWTMKLEDMTPPTDPAAGTLRGKEFRPDEVLLRGGQLVFRQGAKGAFADAQLDVTLFTKAGESVENRTISVRPATSNPAGSPHLRAATLDAGQKLPAAEAFVNKYALKLTFGAKDAAGGIPGTIYVCLPDAGRSFLAGSFTVRGK